MSDCHRRPAGSSDGSRQCGAKCPTVSTAVKPHLHTHVFTKNLHPEHTGTYTDASGRHMYATCILHMQAQMYCMHARTDSGLSAT